MEILNLKCHSELSGSLEIERHRRTGSSQLQDAPSLGKLIAEESRTL